MSFRTVVLVSNVEHFQQNKVLLLREWNSDNSRHSNSHPGSVILHKRQKASCTYDRQILNYHNSDDQKNPLYLHVSITYWALIMMCTPATWEAHHFHHAIDTLNFSLISQQYASYTDPRWYNLTTFSAPDC